CWRQWGHQSVRGDRGVRAVERRVEVRLALVHQTPAVVMKQTANTLASLFVAWSALARAQAAVGIFITSPDCDPDEITPSYAGWPKRDHGGDRRAGGVRRGRTLIV